MERFFERSDELTGDTRLADAFSKFATDAGMEVVGPPLAESDPLTSDDGTRARDRLDERKMIARPDVGGRALRAGDQLPVGAAAGKSVSARAAPKATSVFCFPE